MQDVRNDEISSHIGTYKVLLFGQGRSITREEADATALDSRKIGEIYVLPPFIQRGRWMISNPLPSSLLNRYLDFVGLIKSVMNRFDSLLVILRKRLPIRLLSILFATIGEHEATS